MSNRVARVSMFVTPTNPRFIDKAWTRGGDVYILDIEDSIAPAEKERCRTLIRESIHKAGKPNVGSLVRSPGSEISSPRSEGKSLIPDFSSERDCFNPHIYSCVRRV